MIISSYLWELGAPPRGPRPGLSRFAWLQLGGGEGVVVAVEWPRPTGSLRGAEEGRAAACPARKENLLPAEAALSPACLLGAPSLRDCPAQACATGLGQGILTLLRESSRNGHSLGHKGRRLFPPFRHNPIPKCPMQLPGRTGIFGAVTLIYLSK